jgi:hypothetical protein
MEACKMNPERKWTFAERMQKEKVNKSNKNK